MRPFLHLYPERTPDGAVSEVWQAEKWNRELSTDQLTPMVLGRGSQQFYVHELAYSDERGFLIPIQWYLQSDELHGDCWEVTETVRDLNCEPNY